MITNKKIKTVVEKYLDTGVIEEGYDILNVSSCRVGYCKDTGVADVVDIAAGTKFLVVFETLIPLHGGGVDDLNTVVSVTEV